MLKYHFVYDEVTSGVNSGRVTVFNLSYKEYEQLTTFIRNMRDANDE